MHAHDITLAREVVTMATSCGRFTSLPADEGVLSPTGLDFWHSSSVRRIYTSAAAKEAAQANNEQKAS